MDLEAKLPRLCSLASEVQGCGPGVHLQWTKWALITASSFNGAQERWCYQPTFLPSAKSRVQTKVQHKELWSSSDTTFHPVRNPWLSSHHCLTSVNLDAHYFHQSWMAPTILDFSLFWYRIHFPTTSIQRSLGCPLSFLNFLTPANKFWFSKVCCAEVCWPAT